jgi:hypothetical protein
MEPAMSLMQPAFVLVSALASAIALGLTTSACAVELDLQFEATDGGTSLADGSSEDSADEASDVFDAPDGMMSDDFDAFGDPPSSFDADDINSFAQDAEAGAQGDGGAD